MTTVILVFWLIIVLLMIALTVPAIVLLYRDMFGDFFEERRRKRDV